MTESTLNDLYLSAVAAFPETQKRQHATDTIKIARIQWTPYMGVRTLMVRGLAQNEGREYSPMIVFKDVRYHDKYDDPNLVILKPQMESREYFLEQLRADRIHVLVRCGCQDFFWRGVYADHLDRSLFGRNRRKYEAIGTGKPANPNNAPMMCKHLMKLQKAIMETGLLQ